MGKSLWSQSVEIAPRERLEKELRADAVVLGAGMAGVLTARALQKRGAKVIVLEADRIGGGQTKNTTAKLTSQHGMIYDALIQKFGPEKAGQYARANAEAVRAMRALLDELGVDCVDCPAYVYSTVSADPLRREAEAARSLGLDAAFTRDTELPFAIKGAARMAHQARFHPLRLLKAASEGLEIYERSAALTAEKGLVRTAQGAVRAEHIVFATHYPFVNAPGWFFLRMHQERSYVLALESEWLPEGMYIGADADGLSLREADGLLLAGGEAHRTGENSAGGRYERLLERTRAFAGKERARWSAQDCVTVDGVPYIGLFSEENGWYVATGFGKWGMSSSMASALLLSGQIAGGAPDWTEVFAPMRFQLSASAKSAATELTQACKGLARGFFAFPRALLDELPRGHGGIVEAEGRKAGVYKDENGECHFVDPRCPHLGCQVEWNPDERSWDCPCHGSRFRFNGALIDNPAQEGLQ